MTRHTLTIELSEGAYKHLHEYLSGADLSSIPFAMTETDVIELALYLMTVASNPEFKNVPAMALWVLAVFQWSDNR